MARRITNVSGQLRTLQDSHGRWHPVEPDGVYVVDDRDERDFDQPGIWAELAPTKTKTKPTTTNVEEAS